MLSLSSQSKQTRTLTHIFLVDRIFISVNRKYEQATDNTVPAANTHTKLLMSDSSALICSANFIRELHRLREHLGETERGTSTVFYAHMLALLQSRHGSRHLRAGSGKKRNFCASNA